jgi:hypothetical protein
MYKLLILIAAAAALVAAGLLQQVKANAGPGAKAANPVIAACMGKPCGILFF